MRRECPPRPNVASIVRSVWIRYHQGRRHLCHNGEVSEALIHSPSPKALNQTLPAAILSVIPLVQTACISFDPTIQNGYPSPPKSLHG